jgi:hypothetical protein
MMRLSVALLLSGWLALGVVACARRSAETAPAKTQAGSAPAATPAPAGSKLAAVKEGMRPEEVQKILGVPESIRPYITGKAFIPFYYGRDRTRTAYYYKGQGVVVFSGDGGFGTSSRVQRVEYNPNEPGYAR